MALTDTPEDGAPVQIGISVDETAPTAAGEGDVRRVRGSAEGDMMMQPAFEGADIATVDGVFVQGPVANDAPAAGNPIPIGGVAVAGLPVAVDDGDRVDSHFDELGNSGIFIGEDGGVQTAVVEGSADSVGAAQIGLVVQAKTGNFNGSTWDRQRGNTEVTQIASASRVASTNGPDQTNFNSKGVIITLDVTVDPGGGETLQLLVQHKDAVSLAYEVLLDDGANATPGRRTVIVYPGAGAAANDVTTVNGFPLPRTWRVRVVHSAGGAWTYSVGASNIN